MKVCQQVRISTGRECGKKAFALYWPKHGGEGPIAVCRMCSLSVSANGGTMTLILPHLKVLRRDGSWYESKPNEFRCAPHRDIDEFYRYVAAMGRCVGDKANETGYMNVYGVVLVFGTGEGANVAACAC